MKLVREHINEKFTQESDPVSDLNIGIAAHLDQWIKTTNEYKNGYISKEKDYLWICSKHNQVDFVRYLLSKGADVHIGNDYALRSASVYGHEKVVKLLLDAGANVHAVDDFALQGASTYNYDKVVKLLLDADANVHVDNDAALRGASYNGHDKVVKLLLDAGADLHTQNDYALRWASRNGHDKVVKHLLNAGADAHARDDYALRWASENGHEQVVKLLLDAGADVHANDDLALRRASYYGNDKVVKLLLDAGANVHADNDAALRAASVHGHDKVVKILKDHIAKEKKTVKESLNEKFTQDSDPISDLGIGKKVVIEKWLKKMKIENYVINDDFSIDVHNSVIIEDTPIYKLPKYIQFNEIYGSFVMNNCKLKSLRGFPKIVGSLVSIENNDLKSLKYAPDEIHVTLFIRGNPISKIEIIKYLKKVKNNGKSVCVTSKFGQIKSWLL